MKRFSNIFKYQKFQRISIEKKPIISFIQKSSFNLYSRQRLRSIFKYVPLSKPFSSSNSNKQDELKTLDDNAVMRILFAIEDEVDKELTKTHPDLEVRRRKALNYTNDEYKLILLEYMATKAEIYSNVSKIFPKKFNTTYEELIERKNKINPSNFNKKNFQLEAPEFTKGKPDSLKVKEILLYAMNKYLEELELLLLQKPPIGKSSEEKLLMTDYTYLMIKIKVEDYVFAKFQLPKTQLNYLSFEYDFLYHDKEFQELQAKCVDAIQKIDKQISIS